MPRKPDHFKKSGPPLEPGKATASSAAGDERRVIQTPAGAAVPFKAPPGAVNSVFNIKREPFQKRPRLQVDLAAIKVHKALPIPPRTGAPGHSKYAEIWAQLAAGDCAELPDRQAHGLASWCKKQQHAYTVRRLTPDTKGIWRTA